jgi:hypothetical protein
MTDKSGNQGQSQSQNQNTAQSVPSVTPTPRILPKVDPAKTINLIQEGYDPKSVEK